MTQMQAARKGEITEIMKQAAAYDKVEPEFIRAGLADGTIVVPRNVHHNFSARAIGRGLSTKVNANIGTSAEHCDLAEEVRKLEVAVKHGADSVMDLSTAGRLDFALSTIIERAGVMVGNVPIYACIAKLAQDGKTILDMTADDLFAEIESQARLGVDFMTVHAGITLRSLSFLENDPRVMGVVSRGGSLLKRWMLHHDRENPLYEHYDRLLDICEEHDITLSLGDGFRPGAQADATDRGQVAEMLVLGELVDRARKRGVQVMVEGPGHVPLDEVVANVMLEKKLCNDAPFYVLGPLVTDIAPGYDHIVGAIGGALAAAHGVDFLCYVTPAEHLCLPTEDDVKRGVIASKIAAHAGDIVKRVPGAIERDHAMSHARREFDWKAIYRLSLDPELARERKENSESGGEDYCSMCGELCAVRTDRESEKERQ
ncbi:MAG: phosphomethylpyrimidine synthase ThiC [Candidatus Cloacimonetes bacterium]|nr:phosphomethylpyrimidine synthase ThiC [Candidatus Cloacimonadota bacterium]